MSPLSKETRIGLTFGQILSLLGMVGAIATVYVNINIRLTELSGKINSMELRTEQLETGRLQNAVNIETIRKENREDHYIISVKIDEILKRVKQ